MILASTIFPAALTVGVIALVLSVVIVLVFRFFAVESDERAEALTELLPGANCGGCGYSGCAAYAEALCSGQDKDFSKCTAGGKETAQTVSAFFGAASSTYIPKVARVHCQGSQAHVHYRYAYRGSASCASVAGLYAGPLNCTFGCLGLGDCERACPYDAIKIENDLSVIDPDRCIACGKCVKTCPRSLIKIVPKYSDLYMVACSNPLPGGEVRKVCDIGCIGCRRCVKACPYGAIEMIDQRAVINQEKCQHCGACAEVCPTHAIMSGLELSHALPTGEKIYR